MSFELDPREVLMHLHELGYYNITPEQLEEFIKDLKRLIKYDIAKKRRIPVPQKPSSEATEDSSTFPNTTEESRSPSPPIVQHQRVKKHHKNCGSHSGRTSTREPPEMSRSSSDSSVAAGRTVLRECEKYAAQKSQERVVLKDKRVEASKTLEQSKPSKPCDCNWRTIGCKNCDEHWTKEQNSIKATKSKENLAPRPKSSFIRTWKATGQPRPGSANQRCDPVTLYHQYQQVWKQQKLPGENNHDDLRWTIRERMLGQHPQPRPLSQASSMSSMNRRQKRL